jgi:Holliday junction resolvasome RuvABC endonuclease subunit
VRVVGIDPDTKSVTCVILDDAGYTVSRIEAKGRRAEDRIWKLWKGLKGLVLTNVPPIDWAFVEVPVLGRNAKALRDQAAVVGMIRYWLWDQGIDHSMVDNTVWKKGVLGSGNAAKEEIAAYAQKVLKVLDGVPQDVFDAACVAQYGRKSEGHSTR